MLSTSDNDLLQTQKLRGEENRNPLIFLVRCSLFIYSLCSPYTVVTDPDDPRFDLEKLLAKWEQSS